MDNIQYFYRILIDNVPAPDGWVEHNTKSFHALMERFIVLREVNPHAIVTMEVSPWYREIETIYGPFKTRQSSFHCPGCEYASCLVGGK